MSIHILRAAAFAAALLPPGWAVAAPISLDQALESAVERSRTAFAARAGSRSALEMARAAGQQPDPMLSLGIDNLPVTGRDRFGSTAEEMTMKRVGIAQEWIGADKRAAREAVAQAVMTRESTTERIAAAETRMQTALAYVDAYYAGELLKLAALNEMHAHEELAAGKGRLASASGGSSEVLALMSAIGGAEDESRGIGQQQSAAMLALLRWTGLRIDAPDLPRLAVLPLEEAYVSAHPAVVARSLEIDVARREVHAAALNRRPNWTYEVSYGQRQGRPDLISVGVRIPLPVAPAARQDRETAARQALLDKAEAELEEARRAAAGEYAALLSDSDRLQERIGRFEDAVLVPLRQRTATTLASYRSNQSSLVMLFESRHAELEAQRKLLSLQRELARVRAQVVFKPIRIGVAP